MTSRVRGHAWDKLYEKLLPSGAAVGFDSRLSTTTQGCWRYEGSRRHPGTISKPHWQLAPDALATALPEKFSMSFTLQHSRRRHLSQECGEKSCQVIAAPPMRSEALSGSKAGTKAGTRRKNTPRLRGFMVETESQPGSGGKESETEIAERLPTACCFRLRQRMGAEFPGSWM